MRTLLILLFLLPYITFAATFPARTDYEVCFTPQENCSRLIRDQIDQAKHSIFVQSYMFTSYDLARALVRAQQRGVNVNVILDKSQFQQGQYSSARYLMHHHIPVWNDNQLNIAHNKVMIFDRNTVETGSFNYTKSAQKYNAENVLVIHDQSLAERYLKNWYHREKLSQKVT